MFSQCNVTHNGKDVTQSNEHYNYRSYLEIILTYGTDGTASHLTNTYSYLDTGEMQPCDSMVETHTATAYEGFIARWTRLSGSNNVQLFGQSNTDLCNVPLFLLPGVKLQIRLTKARPTFYLMNKNADFKTIFKFFDSNLLGRRVHPISTTLSNQTMALRKGP